MATEITLKRTSTQQLALLCKQQEAKEWIEEVLGISLGKDVVVSV